MKVISIGCIVHLYPEVSFTYHLHSWEEHFQQQWFADEAKWMSDEMLPSWSFALLDLVGLVKSDATAVSGWVFYCYDVQSFMQKKVNEGR